MKPIYSEASMKWRVKGMGYFDTPEDAWRAIRLNERKTQLLVMVSKKMKIQLEELADKRKTTISDIVRQAIEKEVMNNG